METRSSPAPAYLGLIKSGLNWLTFGFIMLMVYQLFGITYRYISLGSILFSVLPSVLCLVGINRISGALRQYEEEHGYVPSREEIDAMFTHQPVGQTEVVTKTVKTELPERSWKQSAPAPVATKSKPEWKAPDIDWEEWVGKKLLQKVGIVIVLIGMAIFLKYSIDRGYLDEMGRLVLSGLLGAGLLAFGEWHQSRYNQWSHTFTGGGLTMLYFTVWAAHVLYGPALQANYGLSLSPVVAMILYSAITALGAFASVRYKAQTIAWFAMLGGYLTPMIINNVSLAPGMLTVYLAILTMGVLGLAWYQRWRWLNLAAFALTHLYLAGTIYPADMLITSAHQIVIAIGFFIIFGALPLLYQFRLKEKAQEDDVLLIVANAVAVFAAVNDALGGFGGHDTALLSVALAAVYIGYSSLALLRRPEDSVLVNTYLVASVILTALAVYVELKPEWVAAGWAPLSVLVLWLAVKLRRPGLWHTSYILLIGSLIFLSINMPLLGSTDWRPFASDWAMQSYAVFASVAGWLFLSKKLSDDLVVADDRNVMMHLLHAALALIAFCAVSFEATQLQFGVSLHLAFVYLAFAGICVFAFTMVRSAVWLAMSLFVQALVFIFLFMSDVSPLAIFGGVEVTPFFHAWTVASLLLLALASTVIWLSAEKTEYKINIPSLRWLLVAAAMAQVWIHGTSEILHMQTWDHWGDLTTARTLGAWWIVFGLVTIAVAMRWNFKGLLKAGVLLLFIPLLKDLMMIASGDSSFFETILWTVLPMGLAIVGTVRKEHNLLKGGMVMLGMTAAIDMFLRGSSDDGLLHSIWWAIAALTAMASGFGWREKMLRRFSIGLFGAITVKLLLVDFAVFEPLTRTVASVCTGLLMVGASYFYQRFDSIFSTKK